MVSAVVLAILLFLPSLAHATTRYVDNTPPSGCVNGSTNYTPTGTGACPGGSSTIFTGINNSLNGSTVAGDIIYIRAGTYNEYIDSNSRTIPTGTSYANAPIISAYPGETVIQNGSINLPAGYIQYLIFQNYTVDGTPLGSGNFDVVSIGADNDVGYNPHHVKFSNMEIRNGGHQCVKTGRYTSFIWFTGGSSHACGLLQSTPNFAGYPFYISGKDTIIEGMDIYNSNGYCVQVYSGYPEKPDRTILRGNFIHNCASQHSGGGAVVMFSGANMTAYNNVIYSSTYRGIIVGANTTVYSNTIYNVGTYGIEIYTGSSGVIARNNIINAHGSSAFNILATATVSNNLCQSGCPSGNSNGNPLFVNPGGINFSLQAGSPAIDTGATLGSPWNTDIVATSRPQGTAYDLGAYEKSSGPPSDPAPPVSPGVFLSRLNGGVR